MKKRNAIYLLIIFFNFIVNSVNAQEVPGANMILNPSFDVNANGWSSYLDYFWAPSDPNAAKATFSVVAQTGFTGNAYKIAITNAGTQSYSVQISYPVALVAGKKYSIKFKASAESVRNAQVIMQENVGSKRTWYTSTLSVTTTPTTYGPFYYTATTDDSSNRFKLFLGGSGGAVTTYFDDVEVAEMVPPESTVSSAPNITAVTPKNTRVDVAFTAPTDNGGITINSYTVTSSPEGITATGTASPITVRGLTNGTTYTFTVTAINGKGVSNPSAPSSAVTPVFSPTNYYVSSSSGNDNNNGETIGTAVATILKAETMAVPGDTIFLFTGTYPPVTLTKSGTLTRRITYKALSGDNPIITCGLSGAWQLMQINGSYITIDGLEIKGINQSISLQQGETNYNNILAIKEAGGTPTQVQWDATTNTNTNGISIGSGSGATVQYVEVKNCKVHDLSCAGIGATNADYITIENNEIYNTSWYGMWATSGITVIRLSGNGTTIFRGNKVYNNESLVKWMDKRDYSDGNGIIIDVNTGYNGTFLVENNLVYNNGGRGLYIMTAGNAVFRNNTSYWNSKSSFSTGGEMVVYDSHDVTFVNNIGWANPAYSPKNYAICDNGHWGNNSNITWKNNMTFNGTVGNPSTFFNKTTTTSVDNTNKLGVNPLLVNPTIVTADANFHLQSGSPAINAGTALLGVSTFDMDYTARVKGTGIDMGAYESNFTTAVNKISTNTNAFASYPNPVINVLNLLNPNSINIQQIEIYSIRGELIQSQRNIETGLNTINAQMLSAGIYLLKIRTSEQDYFQKIVKE
jgi:hypothetical protein